MTADNTGGTTSVDLTLESTLESADRAEAIVTELAREMGFDEDETFRLGMAVRESVVNAVVHGNRYNRNKKVQFRVTKAKDHLVISIRDEGEGFDPDKLPDPLAEENLLRQSGRGLLLIRSFVDKFEARPGTPTGTEMVLEKYLSRQS